MTSSRRRDEQHSSVILWPVNPSGPSLFSVESSGLILGWIDDENNSNDDDSKDNTARNNNNNQHSIRTTRNTAICVGLIKTVDVKLVQRMLIYWSAKYPCCYSQEENNNDDDDISSSGKQHRSSCPCLTCISYGSFQIVGLWNPNNNINKKQKEETDQSPLLPCIVPTSSGPWWKEENNNCILNDCDDHQQILFYDYCCNNDNPSHYQRRGAAAAGPSDVYPSSSSCLFGFDRTLLRISDGFEMFESFQHYMTSSESSNNNNNFKNDDHNNNNNNNKHTSAARDVPEQCSQQGEQICSFHPSTTQETTSEASNVTFYHRMKQSVSTNSLLVINEKQKKYDRSSRFALVNVFQLLHDDEGSIWKLNNEMEHSDNNKKIKFTPRQVRAQRVISHVEKLSSVTLDCLLGVALGVFIMYKTDSILAYIRMTWNVFHNHMLRDNIGWLETFPVGFKLNVPLTRKMGREIIMVIGIHDFISTILLTDTSHQHWALMFIGLIGILFGFSTMVATIFDVIRIVTIHIHVLATFFQMFHRIQLYLLAALWRLFRGKKKNILRKRTDTLEYDSTQLLLGMILFTIVLFLFTTILVYYTFFTVLNLTVSIVGATVWILYVAVRNIPLGTCFLRSQHSNWFTKDVYIEELGPGEIEELKLPFNLQDDKEEPTNTSSSEVPTNRISTRLMRVSQTFSAIISGALSHYFTVLLSTLPSFLLEVLCGSPCTVLTVCLLNAGNPKFTRINQ